MPQRDLSHFVPTLVLIFLRSLSSIRYAILEWFLFWECNDINSVTGSIRCSFWLTTLRSGSVHCAYIVVDCQAATSYSVQCIRGWLICCAAVFDEDLEVWTWQFQRGWHFCCKSAMPSKVAVLQFYCDDLVVRKRRARWKNASVLLERLKISLFFLFRISTWQYESDHLIEREIGVSNTKVSLKEVPPQ